MNKIEQTVEQMVFALRENHYYMIDAGLPNQSMLNQNNKAIQAGRALLEELKGQPNEIPTLYVYRLENGVTQVMAPEINDSSLVIDMLEQALVAMSDEGHQITRN